MMRAFRRLPPLLMTRVNQAAVFILLAVTIAVYCLRHQQDADRPRQLGVSGWWRWHDQGEYLRAAHAWAAGNLAPAEHWYLPGYPLIGALFTRLTPVQPFFLPDLLCLVILAWLVTRLSEALFPRWRWATLAAAVSFLFIVLTNELFTKSFIEPWTTTPTAPLTCASLLLALRFQEKPSEPTAALIGFLSAAGLLFRPTDAMIVSLCIGIFMLPILVRDDRLAGRRAAVAIAAVAGGVFAVLMLLFAYLPVHGFTLSGYIRQSRAIGFEWRLIPLRWVLLFVSPKPLFDDGMSMVQMFPWILPGIAGMVACVVGTRGEARARHLLVAGLVALHILVLLAYRDLHPQGLYRYSNYHYFKWTLPVFGLYGVYLLAPLSERRWRAWAAGAAVVAGLFSWRAEWHSPLPGYAAKDAVVQAPRTLVLPHGLHDVRDGVLVAATGSFPGIYLSSYAMQRSGRLYYSNADIKAFPEQGGLMFTELRPIPPGPVSVLFDPSVHLRPDVAPVFGRQDVVFGLPDWGNRLKRRLPKWLQTRM